MKKGPEGPLTTRLSRRAGVYEVGVSMEWISAPGCEHRRTRPVPRRTPNIAEDIAPTAALERILRPAGAGAGQSLSVLPETPARLAHGPLPDHSENANGLPTFRALHFLNARVVPPQPPVPCGGQPLRFSFIRRPEPCERTHLTRGSRGPRTRRCAAGPRGRGSTSGSGRRPCWPVPCGRCRPCA
jgi:hypothetical protein